MVLDPFDGFFEELNNGQQALPGYLNMPRAHSWLDRLGWTVENDVHTYQLPLEGHSGAHVRIQGRDFVMASSYNYLGLIGHPDIDRAAIDAVRDYGTGTGGVRLLTGTCELHRELEVSLARFKGTEAAIVFSSGYVANLAAISGMMDPRDRVIVDEKAHRSILDGCRLSRARVRRFAHNNVDALEEELCRESRGRSLVIVEGIYSMDGDICPLPEIVALKKRYAFTLMVDEAHSIGVLGRTGRGVDEHFGIPSREIDLWMGSLSKAIPANGGYLAGTQAAMVYLKYESAPFMFSAALCPSAVASSLAALRIIADEPSRVRTLARRAAALREGLRALGLDTDDSSTAIVPVILGSNERTYRFSRGLFERGVLASAVVQPAVPEDTSRLRLCAMACHSEEDIDTIVDACAAVMDEETTQ